MWLLYEVWDPVHEFYFASGESKIDKHTWIECYFHLYLMWFVKTNRQKLKMWWQQAVNGSNHTFAVGFNGKSRACLGVLRQLMCAQSPRVCSYLQLIFLPFWEAISRCLILCYETTSSPPLLWWNLSLPRFICQNVSFPPQLLQLFVFFYQPCALQKKNKLLVSWNSAIPRRHINVRHIWQSCEKNWDWRHSTTALSI